MIMHREGVHRSTPGDCVEHDPRLMQKVSTGWEDQKAIWALHFWEFSPSSPAPTTTRTGRDHHRGTAVGITTIPGQLDLLDAPDVSHGL